MHRRFIWCGRCIVQRRGESWWRIWTAWRNACKALRLGYQKEQIQIMNYVWIAQNGEPLLVSLGLREVAGRSERASQWLAREPQLAGVEAQGSQREMCGSSDPWWKELHVRVLIWWVQNKENVFTTALLSNKSLGTREQYARAKGTAGHGGVSKQGNRRQNSVYRIIIGRFEAVVQGNNKIHHHDKCCVILWGSNNRFAWNRTTPPTRRWKPPMGRTQCKAPGWAQTVGSALITDGMIAVRGHCGEEGWEERRCYGEKGYLNIWKG